MSPSPQSLVTSHKSQVLRHLFHLMLGIEENDAVSAAFFGEVEGIVHALVEARLGLLRRGGGAADAGGEEGAVGELDTPEGLLQTARYDERAGGVVPGRRMTNSSPPQRPAKSVGRIMRFMMAATSRITSSPLL